ncbi:MAG: hypothetical protein LBK60_00775 [Verrucomicrobiales bacterium]|nr:hypothetical protein [Verrucomicrobiales bacterium]
MLRLTPFYVNLTTPPSASFDEMLGYAPTDGYQEQVEIERLGDNNPVFIRTASGYYRLKASSSYNQPSQNNEEGRIFCWIFHDPNGSRFILPLRQY